MGGGQSASSNASAKFKEEYTQIRQEYDDHFGEIIIHRKINNPEIKVITKRRIYNSTDEFQKVKSLIKRRQRISSENVCQILTTLEKDESNMCSTFLKLTVVLEYHGKTLDQIYRHRRGQNSPVFS